MKDINNRIKEAEDKLLYLKELKGKINNKEFISIKSNKREFRIYKWENKILKDFPIPKGFEFAEERDFIDLYDNDLIELEQYPIVYFTKNRSQKNIKKGWIFSGLYLNWLLDLGSVGGLGVSYSDGRVVVVSKLKEKN